MTNTNLPSPTYYAPPAVQPTRGLPRSVWTGLAGAAAMIIGAFLPWVSVSSAFNTIGLNGIEGDGKYTAALAAGAGALLWFGWLRKSRLNVTIAMVLSVIAGATTLWDWSTMSAKIGNINSDTIHASIGIGFYATGLGAVVLFASLVDIWGACKKRPVVQSTPPGWAPPSR